MFKTEYAVLGVIETADSDVPAIHLRHEVEFEFGYALTQEEVVVA